MSDEQRGGQQGQGQAQGDGRSRRRRGRRPRSVDLWRPVPHLPDPAPVRPSAEPTALLKSLGDPPLQGQGAVSEHYIAAVIERAAGLATAIAAAGGLLQAGDDED